MRTVTFEMPYGMAHTLETLIENEVIRSATLLKEMQQKKANGEKVYFTKHQQLKLAERKRLLKTVQSAIENFYAQADKAYKESANV